MDFGEKVVCFTGLNGMGKTNLLDAIHYLSTGKSGFNSVDSQNIKTGEKYFTLSGSFTIEEEQEVFVGFTKGRKKVLKLDDVEYDKLYEHYGRFPCVMISPLDIDLITDGSEARRRFIDSSISLYNKAYLQKLVEYNRVLTQRNAMVKGYHQGKGFNQDLIRVYNVQLNELSNALYPEREAFIKGIDPLFNEFIQTINQQQEEVGLRYISQLQESSLMTLLEQNLGRDLDSGRTNYGIHRDQLEFTIGDKPLKKFGSQGQQKSYILALKMAQAKLVESKTGRRPLLLLDDLFDRLDNQRAARLLTLVGDIFDQLFITDTSKERMEQTLADADMKAEFYNVVNGAVESPKTQSLS